MKGYGGLAANTAGTPKRATVRLPRRLVKEYCNVVGLHDARAHSLWKGTSIQTARGTRFIPPKDWMTLSKPPSWTIVRWGLEGRAKVALRKIATTGYIVLDVDLHGVDIPEPALPMDIDAFIAASRSLGLRRKAIARDVYEEIAGDYVRMLVEKIPASILCRTTRGFHVVVKLEGWMDVSTTCDLAPRLLELVEPPPNGVDVESFPKKRADDFGDHCRLPFTGDSRRIDPSTFRLTKQRRRDDIAEWIEARGITEEELVVLVEKSPPSSSPVIRRRARRAEYRVEKEPAPGQLYGEDFVEECMRLLTDGMGPGESRSAMQRLTWAAFACGFDEPCLETIMRNYIAQPHHRANHTKTKQGREQLHAQVPAQIRWWKSGEQQGRLHRGGCNSPGLKRLFIQLLNSGSPGNHQ